MQHFYSGNKVIVNGKETPSCPYVTKNHNNTTVINNHIYVNGYEYKNGRWKRTLKAFFYNIF